MSHCSLLKAARLEQPPLVRRQSAHMSHYHLRSKVALDLVDALSIRAMFGDFPLSGREVRPHAITFSDSCRIDPTVLASFHLVAGELPPP
jgi:aspartyl/asparaginyl beta-hydroxylase (cupin superfamily)